MVVASLVMRWSLSDIWNNARFLEIASALSTLVLIIGAVLEDWPKLKQIMSLTAKLILFRSTTFERRVLKKLVIHSVGAIMVVVGIAGELLFETRTFIVEDRETATLSQEAGNAKQSAGEAAAAAKRAQVSADAASVSAGTARDEADEVAKQAAAQGPRAKLLVKVAPELARKLAPFAGQRVGLFVCGQQGVVDQEMLDAWGVIANILGPDTVSGVAGAKWREVPTNLNFARNCGAAKGLGQGIIVFVSKRALKGTMEAVNVLGHGLANALPPSPNKMPGLIDPDFAELTVDRGFQDKNAPWVLPGLDPDVITVLIGEHP